VKRGLVITDAARLARLIRETEADSYLRGPASTAIRRPTG
jgi:hypothetical protein